MSAAGAPGLRDAGTVPVRVQVIDLEPFALDLVVPTYLPAKDLTQRVARDAGLGAYRQGGGRRLFWLRARGRLLRDEETLDDLGIVPGELLHLLPQPPDGSGVEERPPEYPPNKGYAAAGTLNAVTDLALVLAWTVGWSVALVARPGLLVGVLPSIGLALLAVSFARHLVGGPGSAFKIPVLGLLVFLPLVVIAAVPALVLGSAAPQTLLLTLVPSIVAGFFGVLLGWLAWYGAVEPLPVVLPTEAARQAAEVTWSCGICGGVVTADVKADCASGCGQVFHAGCYAARRAVATGEGCAVCGHR